MIGTFTWVLGIAAVVMAVGAAVAARSVGFAEQESDASVVAAARGRLAMLGKVAIVSIAVVIAAGALNLALEKTRLDTIEATEGPEPLEPGESSAFYYVFRDTSWWMAAFLVPTVGVAFLLARRKKRLPATDS